MIYVLLAGILLIGLFLYGVNFYINARNDYWPKLGVPWVDGNTISNIFSRMTLRSPMMDYHKKLYHSQPDSVKFFGVNELRSTILYVKDLELIRRVLVKDFDHFVDRRLFVSSGTKSDAYFVRMLVNVKGQEWKDLRATMVHTFNTGKIRRMHEFFNSCAGHMTNYLNDSSRHVHDGEQNVVDFQNCFLRYTMDVIASAALGVPTDLFEQETSVFRNMGKQFQVLTFKRMIGILMNMMFPTVAKWLNLQVCDKESMDFFFTNCQEKHSKAQAGQLKDEAAEKMDDYERDAALASSGRGTESAVILDDTTLVAQCVLFFASGADSVETVLTYAVYHLALHPEVQEKLATEVAKAMDAHDGILPYDVTHQLEYLDMVISETLRLHTPGFLLERLVTKAYNVPDTKVVLPVGTRVQVSIVGIHSDAKYYQKPTEFYPEHFTAEEKAKRHSYAYMPFGQGPRNCIAMRFAVTETKTAIANLIYNFRVSPSRKTQFPLKISPKDFKPENGMWLKFESRR